MKVLELLLSIALSIGVPAGILRRDMRDLRWLAGEQLARAWNDASLWSAVVAFGPLSLLVHFARTRRSLWGALLGLFWMAVVIVTSWLWESRVAELADRVL